MTEENKNPFSNEFMSGTQIPGAKSNFNVNQFSSEQAPFPQFGNIPVQDNIRERIEAAKSNGWGSKLGGFARSHNKKFLIFAAMALLFMGGSYLTNRNDAENAPAVENADFSGSVVNLGNDKDAAALGENDVPVNVLDIKINEDGQVLFPEESGSLSSQVGSSITETTVLGDGITHLARRALKTHLSQTGKQLNAEQKVYAEDYVQNAIGNEWLEVGQKLSFSEELLNTAINKAQQLQNWQIENLKQYTQ